jgi:O-antigen/teichoic acid export membrane protein
MIIRSAAQISLIVVGFGLIAMIASYAVATLVVSIGGLVLLSTRITVPTREHFKNLYEYAKFSWLWGLKAEAFQNVDILLLGIFVQPSLVGIYSAAWTITQFLALFDSAVSSTLFPEISRADAEDNRQTVANLVEQSLAYGGLILIPGLFGGVLLGERLMRIYGSEFVQGASVLWLLILAMLLYSYEKQLLNALNGLDRPKKAFQINAVFIGTNIVLNILLIPLFGVIGAAVATALSAVVGMILSIMSLQSEIEFSIPFSEILRQFTAGVVMTVIVTGTQVAIANLTTLNHNFVMVILLVIIGSIVYFVTLFGISTRFRSTVTRNIPIWPRVG